MPKVPDTSGADPFVLFTGKERAKMAAPREVQHEASIFTWTVTTQVGHQHGHQGYIKLLGAAFLCGRQQGYSYDKLLDITTKTNTTATPKRRFALHCYIQGLS